MTAQCKVLHLLFSQSDYPKIVECHIIQSVCVCVFLYVCVCVITERLWRRLSETKSTTTMCMSSVKVIRGARVPGMTL